MAEETAQMKLARESAEKRGETESAEWVLLDGKPMVKITCAASELIATRNYSNITVGPISVSRFISDGDDTHIAAAISSTQALCETAIAEERQTIAAWMRAAKG